MLRDQAESLQLIRSRLVSGQLDLDEPMLATGHQPQVRTNRRTAGLLLCGNANLSLEDVEVSEVPMERGTKCLLVGIREWPAPLHLDDVSHLKEPYHASSYDLFARTYASPTRMCAAASTPLEAWMPQVRREDAPES